MIEDERMKCIGSGGVDGEGFALVYSRVDEDNLSLVKTFFGLMD